VPLSGRIVAVADVFDALTHARPYKPAWSADAAATELHRLRGRQFDPDVVDAFAAIEPRLVAAAGTAVPAA
jgi:putative two-component system response regulator